MNENAIAPVGGSNRLGLGGLAQRLVQDGLLDEAVMQEAIAKSKEKRLSLVSHLVAFESGYRARYSHFRLE